MPRELAELEAQRPALTGHCYRMLGSAADAGAAVGETITRAWRAIDGFNGRSELRKWMYHIATNVCLDALKDRTRRAHPTEEHPAGRVDDALLVLPKSHWLEPIPDAQALPPDADPSELPRLRDSLRLPFVGALQRLPPQQRAALLLREVLDWPVEEVAESLHLPVELVNGGLQRARAALASRDLRDSAPVPEAQSQLLKQYVDAFHRFNVNKLASLLSDDATFTMPPYTLWLRGPDAVRAWLRGRGADCKGSRLLPAAACGSPAFGQYRQSSLGGWTPWALVVLELSGDRIAGWNSFLDAVTLFPQFGLPPVLPAKAPASRAKGTRKPRRTAPAGKKRAG